MTEALNMNHQTMTEIASEREYSLPAIERDFRAELEKEVTAGIYSRPEQFDILRTIELTRDGHAGLYRQELTNKGKRVPELYHLLEVGLMAIQHRERAIVVCAALLHDYRENSKNRFASKDTLGRHFNGRSVSGPEIEKIVHLLTGTELDEKIDTQTYYAKIKTNPAAIRIKAYDRISNLRSFSRMLTKVSLQPELYPAKIKNSLLSRVLHNIAETRNELLPILRDNPYLIEVKMAIQAAKKFKGEGWTTIQESIFFKRLKLGEELESLTNNLRDRLKGLLTIS